MELSCFCMSYGWQSHLKPFISKYIFKIVLKDKNTVSFCKHKFSHNLNIKIVSPFGGKGRDAYCSLKRSGSLNSGSSFVVQFTACVTAIRYPSYYLLRIRSVNQWKNTLPILTATSHKLSSVYVPRVPFLPTRSMRLWQTL